MVRVGDKFGKDLKVTKELLKMINSRDNITGVST